jgi:hypothetical protein
LYARYDLASYPYFVLFNEECSFPTWFSVIFLYIPDDRYNWSSISFSDSNFKGASDLLHARKNIWMDYSTTLLRFWDRWIK